MGTVKVVPRSLTDAYKRREGDFAPNLVGLQFTDGVSLFTFGNFQITTNLDRKLNKNFALGGEWSEYYNLENLNLTPNQSETLVSNDIFVRLNFDINNLSRYVYFGSFYEFARVTIEQIISKWKGSIYLNPTSKANVPINTVLSFSYDSGTDKSSFLVPKSVINNPFELIVDDNQDFSNLTSGDIFNLSRDYNKYVIWTNNQSFNVIGYTGSTSSYPYMRVTTKGNPFPSLTATTFGQLTYHIKPNDTEVELFFNQLEDFEKIILNRLTTPIYTSSFNVPQEADGFLVFNERRLTWPISDGYNLDINTNDYAKYVESMLEMASLFDSYKTDLVARRFVSESIHEFDTNGGEGEVEGNELYGRKANKLLRIYGREFDQVKKYIDGISFANVVTYDKLDNTSDELIKIMAKTLGFDTLLTVTTDNFDLLQQNAVSYETIFSGHSRSLSAKELDIELWRRLVINAWWLWKSKGTRKVIEFFFNLFNIPGCMITLDEYVYLAKDRLDFDKVWQQIADIYGGLMFVPFTNDDIPMDVYGFPRVLPETNDNYFQMNGFWYNGGNESTNGNNPHIGDYDFGKKYFEQFECFVPEFNDLLTGSTTVTVNKNYFNNYNEGTFIFDQNGLPVPYYGTKYATTLNNGLVQNAIVNNAGLTYVGGSNAPKYGTPSGDTYSMKLSFTTGTKQFCEPCAYDFVFGNDGIVYVKGNPNTPLTDQKCCQNYWLPTQSSNPRVVCPKPSELMISSPTNPLGPCIVLDNATKSSVPQSCCNKQTLGFDVAWDGKNCVDAGCVKSAGGTVPVAPVEVKGVTFTATELFAGQVTDTAPSTFTCYWCPPDASITVVCSVDQYTALLTPTEVDQLATSLGWTNNGTTSTAFLNTVLTPFFTTNGCLYLDNLNKPINNSACCTLKGGNWNLINGKYYCVKPVDNPCANNTANANHVLVNTTTNSLTTQECCSTLGYTWTDGLITMVGESSFNDSVGLSFVNSFGGKFYCTACPTSLITVNDCDGFGVCSLIIKDSVTNTNLSQQCCTDYGFSYDAATGKCLKCPTVLNYEATYPYTITQLNGSNLSQSCCETTIVGSSPSFSTAWYGIADINGNNSGVAKCYQCPAIYYYANGSQTTATPNTNYTILDGEVLYNGQSLSQTCCNNYNSEVGGVSFDAATQKCLLPQQQATSQAFTLKFGDTSCGTSGPAAGTQTRQAWIINPPFSANYASPGVNLTVYVPIGQTPLTSPMFIDAALTTYVSPLTTFNSPNGRWERTFEYNNNVYNLNFGSLVWTAPTFVTPWPTPVLKGQIGLNCSGF
jgi:hypothetical protein